MIIDGESNGGGIVPYLYKAENFHNAVQWAAGWNCSCSSTILARLLHDRSSERRAVHDLSRYFRAAHEPRPRPTGSPICRKEAVALTTLPSIDARIHVQRNRHHDPRRARETARPQGSRPSGAGALADVAVYAPTGRSRRCSAPPISSSRMAISSCATARHPLPLGQGAEGQSGLRQRSTAACALLRRSLRHFARLVRGAGHAFGVADPFEEVACAR